MNGVAAVWTDVSSLRKISLELIDCEIENFVMIAVTIHVVSF
jgi:hypothetical protein